MKLINPYSTEERLRRFRQIASDTTRQYKRGDGSRLSVPSQGTCPLRGRESSSINTISGIRPFVMGMMPLFLCSPCIVLRWPMTLVG